MEKKKKRKKKRINNNNVKVGDSLKRTTNNANEPKENLIVSIQTTHYSSYSIRTDEWISIKNIINLTINDE